MITQTTLTRRNNTVSHIECELVIGFSALHSVVVGRTLVSEWFNRSFVAASLKGFRRAHCVRWMLVSSPHVSLLLARNKPTLVLCKFRCFDYVFMGALDWLVTALSFLFQSNRFCFQPPVPASRRRFGAKARLTGASFRLPHYVQSRRLSAATVTLAT